MPSLSTPKQTGLQEAIQETRRLYAQIKAGKVAPVYLFYGEDEYLREQVARNVAFRLVPEGDRLTNLTLLEGSELPLEALLSQVQTAGFRFGDTSRQVILVRHAPWFRPRGGEGTEGDEREGRTPATKPPVDLTDALYQRLERGLREDLTLIFTVAGPVDKRLRLFKLLHKIGLTLEFSALKNEGDVADLVQLKLSREGVRIDPEALHELAVRVGTDTQILTSELNKLSTFVAERRHITHADVVALVAPTAELSVFELVDAVAERKTSVALDQLRGMLAQQAPPFMILGMLIRQFRLLLQARYVLDQNLLGGPLWQQEAYRFHQALHDPGAGPSPLQQAQQATAEIFPETGRANLLQQHYFPLWKSLRQAQAFTSSQLQAALERLLQADLSLKTSHLPEEQALELLVVDLCERIDEGATIDLDELLEG